MSEKESRCTVTGVPEIYETSMRGKGGQERIQAGNGGKRLQRGDFVLKR